MGKRFLYLIGIILISGLSVSCDKDSEDIEEDADGRVSFSTPRFSRITETSAYLNGGIHGKGVKFDSRGICYSTNPNPTVADQVITVAGVGDTVVHRIERLSNNTTYYVRLFARLEGQTVYSKMNSFTTTSAYTPDNMINKYLWLYLNSDDVIDVLTIRHLSQSEGLIDENLVEYSYSAAGLRLAEYFLKEFDSYYNLKYTYQMKLVQRVWDCTSLLEQ